MGFVVVTIASCMIFKRKANCFVRSAVQDKTSRFSTGIGSMKYEAGINHADAAGLLLTGPSRV